jgi:hypothetical protein
VSEAHHFLPSPGPRYRRRLEVQIAPLENGLCEATARLEFQYPDAVVCRVYELVLRIDEATRTIVDARAPVFFAENESCATTLPLVQQLVGLNVLEKYLWRIHRLFGASSGCQHLLELSEEIGRAWFNRMTSRFKQGMESFDPSIVAEHCAGLRSAALKLMGGTR